jgi:ribosomal protein S9
MVRGRLKCTLGKKKHATTQQYIIPAYLILTVNSLKLVRYTNSINLLMRITLKLPEAKKKVFFEMYEIEE